MGKTTKKPGSERHASNHVHRLRSNVGITKSTAVSTSNRPSLETRKKDPGSLQRKAQLAQRGSKNSKLELQRGVLQPSAEAVVNRKKKTKRASVDKEQIEAVACLHVKMRRRGAPVAQKELSDLQEHASLSPECVWKAAPSFSDPKPKDAGNKRTGRIHQKKKPPSSERSFSAGEAFVHESSSVTIVDLGSDFKSGARQPVHLTPVERRTAVKQTGDKNRSVNAPLVSVATSRNNLEKPAQEDWPMQSVVVIDLGSEPTKNANAGTTPSQFSPNLESSLERKLKKRKLSAVRFAGGSKHHLGDSGINLKPLEAEYSGWEETAPRKAGSNVPQNGSAIKKGKKRKSSVKTAVKAVRAVETAETDVGLPSCESDKEVASTPVREKATTAAVKKGRKVSAAGQAKEAGQGIVPADREKDEPLKDAVEQGEARQSDPKRGKPKDKTEDGIDPNPPQSLKSSVGGALPGPALAETAENGAESVDLSGSSSASLADGRVDEEANPMDGIEEMDVPAATSCNSEIKNKPSYRILKLQNSEQCLVLLPHPSKLSFHGRVLLRVVYGSVTIMGFPMSADGDGKFYPAYSPGSSCALCVETSSASAESASVEGALAAETLETFLKAEGEGEMAGGLRGWAEGIAVALVVRKMTADPAMNYVERFPGFGKLFSGPETKERTEQDDASVSNFAAAASIGFHPTAPDSPNAVFDTLPGYHTASQTLRRWLHATEVAPVVLVCGWKNTGKSTLCRFLANSLLPSTGGVCYLECDMAQTEFTPPGMLSLQLITQPLLGPPFTHLRKPEKMCFYGDVNVRSDPESYLQMVMYLLKHYRSRHADKPLIVNTMGWMQGLGFQLLIDIVHIARPTHIVQLRSRLQPRAIQRLTPEVVRQTAGWWHRPVSASDDAGEEDGTRATDPELLEVDMPNLSDQGGAKLKASDHRTMALLASLSHLQPSPMPLASVALSALTPLVLPWRHVAVHVTNGHVPPRQVMYALNGSLVGLCRSDPAKMLSVSEDLPKMLDSTPVCQCLGLGVVRGIDPVQKVFYILTGLSQGALQEVNTLLKGSLTLPQPLLTQGHRVADVPYVSREFSSVIIGSGAIKVRRNIKQRGR